MTGRKIGDALDQLSCLTCGSYIMVQTLTGDMHWLWGFPAWGAAAMGVLGLSRIWKEHRNG